jgi:hypothetical protein
MNPAIEQAIKELDDAKQEFVANQEFPCAMTCRNAIAAMRKWLTEAERLFAAPASEEPAGKGYGGRPLCPKCRTEEGVHGGCDCGYMSPEPEPDTVDAGDGETRSWPNGTGDWEWRFDRGEHWGEHRYSEWKPVEAALRDPEDGESEIAVVIPGDNQWKHLFSHTFTFPPQFRRRVARPAEAEKDRTWTESMRKLAAACGGEHLSFHSKVLDKAAATLAEKDAEIERLVKQRDLREQTVMLQLDRIDTLTAALAAAEKRQREAEQELDRVSSSGTWQTQAQTIAELQRQLATAHKALRFSQLFREFSDEWHLQSNADVVEFIRLRNEALSAPPAPQAAGEQKDGRHSEWMEATR